MKKNKYLASEPAEKVPASAAALFPRKDCQRASSCLHFHLLQLTRAIIASSKEGERRKRAEGEDLDGCDQPE